ncbi:MAG: glycoside hydrolase family 78 protein, partial [Propionibacteriaceae bacterium]|nr:glycoside hydrolase family 78 protein [Propionibacteriaceae bacterium]
MRKPVLRALASLAAVGLVLPLIGSPPVAVAAPYDAATATAVGSLNVNGLDGDQVGLGTAAPTLAWRLTSAEVAGNPCFDDEALGVCGMSAQAAFEVQAAGSLAALDAGPWVWDSGWTQSAAQSVTFGVAQASRAEVYWRVRVTDANGYQSAWSAPARFTVGLLAAADWTARWIEDPGYVYQAAGSVNPLPVFAKPFAPAATPVSATLYATGLGQYTATINGVPVGKAVLEPGETGYWDEVDYRAYDVTGLVKAGSNVIGLEVGSGVYQQADTTSVGRYVFQPGNNDVLGTPKVLAQLELAYADGTRQTIATDASWRTRAGGTTFSSWWGGEDYDARILAPGWTATAGGLGDPAWHAARLASLDSTTIPRDTAALVADPRPPVTVAEEARPVSIATVSPNPVATTVVAPAAAGDTNLKLATVTGLYAGDAVELGGAKYTVTAVGTPAHLTTLAAAAAAGATTINVANAGSACAPGASCEGSASFVVGQGVVVGSGATAEYATVVAVAVGASSGPWGPPPPGTVTIDRPLQSAHETGEAAGGIGTGVTVTPALGAAVEPGTAVQSAPLPAYVLDLGANLVGLPKITGQAPAGTTVTIFGVENPSTIPVTSYDPVAESGVYHYTFRGEGTETWHSQFTYNGQRYIIVRGLPNQPTPDTVTLLVTYASNASTASFSTCDNSENGTMLNAVYDITERALQGNMQSVLTDCPNREKGPYTGDNLHNIDTELTLYDLRAYEAQLVTNMKTSQRPNAVADLRYEGLYDGLIANIAPEYHAVPGMRLGPWWFLDEPNWGGAVIRIPWALYETYGDQATMATNYDAMVKWLAYVSNQKVTNPDGQINGLGDWSAAQTTDPPQAIIDLGYYEGASTLAKVAAVLGKTADAAQYAGLAEAIKAEYNADYLHVDAAAGTAWYANNTEAANAVALDSHLVPAEYRDAVFASLVAAVADYGYRIGTGSVALGALFRALHDGGRDDVIYRMVLNPAAPGYAFQVLRGQTTLSEDLSGGSSQNHHFLGEVADWLVHAVGGIDAAPGAVAYNSLVFKPATGAGLDDLTCVGASFTTLAGVAASLLTRTAAGLTMTVTVPANTTAEVWVPKAAGDKVLSPKRAEYRRDEAGYAVYAVASGDFVFEAGPAVAPRVPAAPAIQTSDQSVVAGTSDLPHGTVTVTYDGGKPLCVADIAADGTWSCTTPAGIPAGPIT